MTDAVPGAAEDSWPLTPLQSGMLVDALRDPENDADLVQHLFRVEGELDVDAFGAAWRSVIRRHSVFRAEIRWRNLAEPRMVVLPDVPLSLTVLDWSLLGPADQDTRFDAVLRADQERGFRLDTAPLSRITLIRVADAAHLVLWTSHHILMDGWSRALVLRELTTAYAEARTESWPGTERPGPRFGDFTGQARSGDAAASLAFWRTELSDFAGSASLPEMVERRAEPGRSGGTGEHSVLLDGARVTALRELCKQARVTQATVFHAAWGLLLGHYTRSRDVLFGSTVSVRPPDVLDDEQPIGLLINTIPARIRVDRDATIVDWLRANQKRLAAAREHGGESLAELQSAAGLEPGTRLFDSVLVCENYPGSSDAQWSAGQLRMNLVRRFGQTGYPLFVTVWLGETPRIVLEHQRDHLDENAVHDIAEGLLTILDTLAADPSARVGSVHPLTPSARAGIVARYSPPPAPTVSRLVHELIGEQIRRRGAATAVVCGDVTLSYAELDQAAETMARRLRAEGIGPERVVGVFLDRSANLVVALLAVLRAGGVYLPLDPALPDRRLRLMLDDADVSAVVTERALLPRLDAPGLSGDRRLALCVDGQTTGPSLTAAPARTQHPEDLAYLVYTSGSTGTPKGVAITHASVATNCRSIQRLYEIHAEDVVLQFSSIGFDASLEQALTPLLAGATVLLRDQEVWSPDKLLDVVCAQGVTVMELLPEYGWEVVRTLIAHPDPATRLGGLRLVTVGGDVVTTEQLAEWRQVAPHVRAVVSYGPTEGTITASGWVYPGHSDSPVALIGKPLAHIRAYVLDDDFNPAPARVPGEICIGGVAVARGYPGRRSVTADRFAPDPWAGEPGARLYRTGDLGRWLPSGDLEFLGRMDDQVKIRGTRVEPAEVVTALRAHPTVGQAAVVLNRSSPGVSPSLVGYVTPATAGVDPDPARLREFLRGEVPAAAVPSSITVLAELPFNASGKLDRAALPAPDGPRTEAGGADGPSTPLEKALAEVWAEVLGAERVGVHEDFFDLGGHSLTMLRVVARAGRAVGREIPLRLLFRNPTVASLATALDAAEGGGGRD
ncbi:amino acid adenylation domain-containing protein [Amycolatopsis sp. NPDC052450]|uniref:amino acid adenylation domain-containing protein n=1 Tax=Amycolatopsis sp. NPDC052450 TaxID=3363937 RepID=UPI0037C77640